MPSKRSKGWFRMRRWPWSCPFCFAPLSKPACINPPGYRGCKRPLPEEVPWGKLPEMHVGICGPTTWKTLTVLGLAWRALMDRQAKWFGCPCWELTNLEYAYLQDTLQNNPFQLMDVGSGRSAFLCRSGIFRLKRSTSRSILNKVTPARQSIVQFHNMPVQLFESDERLSQLGLHLIYDTAMVLVVDLEYPQARDICMLPHASMWSRIVRHCERWNLDSWKDSFQGRIAVAVPTDSVVDGHPFDAEKRLKSIDPELWALLQHTASGHLEYFGGPLGVHTHVPAWIVNLIDYVLG
jgi:hypothetical protein